MPIIPNSGKWLPVREAISLAIYGFVSDPQLTTSGNNVINGLLKGADYNDHATEQSIWEDFEKALNRAAFAGEIHFHRLEKGDLIKIENVHFIRQRGFSLLSNDISDIPSFPSLTELFDDEHSDPSYRDVVVDRASYMTWLNKIVPNADCFDSGASISSPNAPQPSLKSSNSASTFDIGLWTFSEAICWIKWRSPVMLQDYRHSFADNDRHPGYMHFLFWAMEYNGENADISTYTFEAKKLLFSKLVSGDLTATGRNTNVLPNRKPIPPHDFADLDFVEDGSEDVLRFVRRSNGAALLAGEVAFLEPRLVADQVRKLWKPKSKVEQKHELTRLAFQKLKAEELQKMSQKRREADVMEFVSASSNGEVTVSERFVRNQWSKARNKS